MPSGQAVFTHSSRFVQVQVFFEPDTEGPLGLPNLCVGRIFVTRDVVDGPTMVLQGSLVLGVINVLMNQNKSFHHGMNWLLLSFNQDSRLLLLHLFPLLCGVDVSCEMPPFNPVLRFLP